MRAAGDWPSAFEDKHFWLDYLFIRDTPGAYPEIDGLEIEFRVSTEYALVPHFDALDALVLSVLRAGDRKAVTIGWDDQAMRLVTVG